MGIQGMEVWLGPACSGKTARLVESYREALRANRSRMELGRTLWLVPTYRAKQQIVRRLLGGDDVCFSPGVRTFEEFAEEILPYSPDPIRPLKPGMRSLLLRRIIDDLANRGVLKEYGSISQTRGFTELIAQTISEHKRNETWPEELRSRYEDGEGRAAIHDVAAIYGEYQKHLLAHHWYDQEGRFWSAARMLDRGIWGAFPEFTLVVVDGFTDFIETQYHLLGHLARRTERMCLTLPTDARDGRRELFARSHRVLERLRGIGPVQEMREVPARSGECEEAPGAVRTIADQLFENPRAIQPAEAGEGLEVWGLTGPRGEVRHLAVRIQELLREGVRGEEIVVGIRDPESYGDLIDEYFTEGGIPYWCGTASVLRRTPLVIALLQVLRIADEDWSYGALMSGLRNDFVTRGWESENLVRSLGEFLRFEELTEGREAILERLGLRLDRADEDEREDLEKLRRDLWKLSEIFSGWEKSGSWSQWVGRLLHIAHELGISREETLSDSERHAWKLLVEGLEGIAELPVLSGTSGDRWSLSEFLKEFEELLVGVTFSERSSREGEVRVLEASEVRHLEVPYLFLLGLTERSFPSRGGESCIYSERDRMELNGSGIRLQLKEQRLQDEMLLFYGIATRARKHLVLSYPHVDPSGEELNSSPYLEDIRELFGRGAIREIREEHLDPIPPRTQVLGDRDLRITATAEVLERRPGLFAGLIEEGRHNEVCRNLAAAVEMNLRRFHQRGLTAYEGMLENEGNRRYLREKYSPQREFTVSHLESYAACPFRSFVGETMKIGPQGVPGLETDHLLRGTLLHELLSQLHGELNQIMEERELDGDGIREWIADRFEELVRENFRSRIEVGGVIGTLREIERDFLEEWGGPYSRQADVYEQITRKQFGAPMRPVRFELSFGYDRIRKVQNDPLILGEGESQVRLAGRIDRIDLCQSEGTRIYGVVDYKSGGTPKCNSTTVGTGRELQLAVYAMAIEELGLLNEVIGPGEEAVLGHVGYWSLREDGFVSSAGSPDLVKKQADEGWREVIRTARGVIPRLVLAMRRGEFPPFNTDKECTSHCAYKTVCRVNQIRPLEEALGKTWQPGPPDKEGGSSQGKGSGAKGGEVVE